MRQIKHLAWLLVFILYCNHAVAQPQITGFSSAVGYPGTSIAIYGHNFNSVAANNIVFFGAAKGTVTSASTTALTVTIPYGATYGSISVLNTGTSLVGYASYSPFFATYDNSSFVSETVNFDIPVTNTTDTFPNHIGYGDIDGDGLVDIISNNYSQGTVTLYRNTSTPGNVSFAAPVTIATVSHPGRPAVGDIDQDGKPDVVVPCNSGMNVYRNTSTPGSISFAAPSVFHAASDGESASIADLDGDGKADVVLSLYDRISIFRNTGSVDSISFAAKIDSTYSGASFRMICIGDLDRDGKIDIVVATADSGSNITVWRNTSVSGTIKFDTHKTFASPSAGATFVGLVDLNQDNWLEIVSINDNDKLSVYQNVSGSGGIFMGARVDAATKHNCNSFAVGDFDGDTWPDIAMPSISSNVVSVFRDSSSSFAVSLASRIDFPAKSGSAAIAVADIDADGKPDLVVTNQSVNSFSVFRNDPLQPISGSGAVCVGSTLALSEAAAGGTWKSSSTAKATIDSSGLVRGVSAGVVLITYGGTAGTGFTGNRTIKSVTVHSQPTISAGSNVTICSGTSATLSAAGSATTYTWSPSAGLSATTGAGITANPASTIEYTVTGTDINGCQNSATQTVTVNTTPDAVSVSGSGTFCNNTTITATGGMDGTIYFQNTISGDSSTAIASASQLITSSGTYYFRSQSPAGCWGTQGSATLTINPAPAAYSVTGGGAVCSGTSGAAIGLSGTDAGILYKLLRGTSIVSTITGSGSFMSFPPQSVAGTYTAVATNATTGCASNMSGSATVLAGTYASPAIVSVTGGGGYCSGGAGVNIGIAGSAIGINYQLYYGSTPIGGPVAGIGRALSFGLQTGAGAYTVLASNPASGCSSHMSGSTTVYVYPTPATYTVTGGGSYCAGGYGVHIGLSGSASGISYKLFKDGTPVTTHAGTGSAFDFGLFTTGGVYTITATNPSYGCLSIMSDNAVVTVNPLPVITSPVYSLGISSSTTLTGTPAEGTWTSSAPSIASVTSGGTVTGISLGTDVITYTDPDGCSATRIIKILLSGHREAQSEQAATENTSSSVYIAPNPNNGIFTVKGFFGTNDDQEITATIVSMTGQVVYTNKLIANAGMLDGTIQLSSSLAKGVYQLSLHSENETKVLPIVIR